MTIIKFEAGLEMSLIDIDDEFTVHVLPTHKVRTIIFLFPKTSILKT